MTKEQVIKNFIIHYMKGYKMMVMRGYTGNISFYWNFKSSRDHYCIMYKTYGGRPEWMFNYGNVNSLMFDLKSYLNVHEKTLEKYVKECLLLRINKYMKKYRNK